MHNMLTQVCQRFPCMILLTQGQKDHLKLYLSQSLSLLTFHNLGVSMQKICCGLPSGLASTLVRKQTLLVLQPNDAMTKYTVANTRDYSYVAWQAAFSRRCEVHLL